MRRRSFRPLLGLVLASAVTCISFVTFGSAVAARFPIPLPIGNPQAAAVNAALSEFGKAIGDQVPIELSPTDALPTAALPGAPFAPGTAPNIIGSLRASTDGTVTLPPGDYEFTVDVFCMKVSAHSPSGHRYLVAPLRGGAADIFSALDSRAPSYSIQHFAQQILSWDIQAGLPYASMQPAQRAIVDQVLPDFKKRLEGDPLTNMEATYDQYAGKVPGMPSFEDALGRIGQTGQDVLLMQQLRQQMAQPPPTYQQLVQELVPFAPLESGGAGPTPWSRWSDRVYIRFTTDGNFATPGTYQVRVLPSAQVSSLYFLGIGAPPDPGAPVPFSNIVNNPGTPSVQPLTQSPEGGPSPQPSASPRASITSETVAEDPSDRTRTTVGVGEVVKLTFSGASATWSLEGDGGTLVPSGKTATYTASLHDAIETVHAVDTMTHATAELTFTVIEPSGLLFVRVPGSPSFIYHHQGWPDIGYAAEVYVQPDTVNFDAIRVREEDATYSADGYYHWEDGKSHEPWPQPMGFSELVPGKGWLLADKDDVYSGWQPEPKLPGHETVAIPWSYTKKGNGSAGPFTVFKTVTQYCEYKANGTLYAEKGQSNLTLSINSPDYY
jgi:hypothetical protein